MATLLSLVLLRFVLLVGVGCYCWYCQRLTSPLEEDEGTFVRWFKKSLSLILLAVLFYANFIVSTDIPSYNVFLDPTIWFPAIVTLHYTLQSIPLWLRIFVVAAFICLWLLKILSLYD